MSHPADARYYAQLDADARHESAIEAAQSEIYEALLATGHAEVDDERLLLNIDAGLLRAAYRLFVSGARDAALVQFIFILTNAAHRAAIEEAPAFVERRKAESRQEAAAERYENLRDDGRL